MDGEVEKSMNCSSLRRYDRLVDVDATADVVVAAEMEAQTPAAVAYRDKVTPLWKHLSPGCSQTSPGGQTDASVVDSYTLFPSKCRNLFKDCSHTAEGGNM